MFLPFKIRKVYLQGFKAWSRISDDIIHVINKNNTVDVWKLSTFNVWYRVS